MRFKQEISQIPFSIAFNHNCKEEARAQVFLVQFSSFMCIQSSDAVAEIVSCLLFLGTIHMQCYTSE